MAEFTVDLRPGVWALRNGRVALEATGIIRDRGTIRCTLTVLYDEVVVYRDNVSLTGDRSRTRVVKRVLEVRPEAGLTGGPLLALDEAIRQNPPPEQGDGPLKGNGKGGHNNMYDTPSYFQGKVHTLADLTAIVKKWLLWGDDDALAVMLGAVVAHRLGGETPWMLFVAPPSGVKTEMLRMLYGLPGIYPLSDLTARTFASGLDTQGKGPEPSLLLRLHDEVLVLKDLTTVLEMPHDERQAVLAQLREIYDGRFDKAWGTGKELHWQGRLGFIAGVTPVIDQHHSAMGLLGPRFLQVRLKPAGRQESAGQAMKNGADEGVMRTELAEATAAFLTTIGADPAPPEMADGGAAYLAALADLVTQARSPVHRDGYRHEIDYAPEPELPPRLARQLQSLLQGVTLVRGNGQPDLTDMRTITRVALDCIPAIRRRMVDDLYKLGVGGMCKTTDLAQSASYPTTTVRRALEDLQALGLCKCDKGGTGVPDLWGLADEGRKLMDTVSETMEDVQT